MPFWSICKVRKGTKVKTLKHEKPKISIGFQWFFKVHRWLKARTMLVFGGLLRPVFWHALLNGFGPLFGPHF